MERKVKYSVTLTPSIQAQGAELGAQRGMSLSMLIEQLLRKEIEKDEKERMELKAVANARRR